MVILNELCQLGKISLSNKNAAIFISLKNIFFVFVDFLTSLFYLSSCCCHFHCFNECYTINIIKISYLSHSIRLIFSLFWYNQCNEYPFLSFLLNRNQYVLTCFLFFLLVSSWIVFVTIFLLSTVMLAQQLSLNLKKHFQYCTHFLHYLKK